MSRGSGRAPKIDGAADVRALLKRCFDAAGLDVDAVKHEQLALFLDTLVLWRRRLPLVSQTAADDIIAKHVEDAFPVVPLLSGLARAADLGSGGGFPGLVLAILQPSTELILVESQRRKASFLREAVRIAAVRNADVFEGRAEDLPAKTPAPFDLVVSRAVWPTPEFLTRARPLLRSGGLAVAMKTPRESAAVAAAEGFGPIAVRPYELRHGEKRVLIVATAT